MKRLTCIDLFSGCGGFSLGMSRAGFSVLAAIDFNAEAITTLKTNLPEVSLALESDLTKYPPEKLAELIGVKHVDVIIGGPPCQGFSMARQRDGANNGPRTVEDKRRHLYKEFLRYVDFFHPKVFIMENVLGIKSADNGHYFTCVQQEARALGYRVHPRVEKAFELGVPQKRIRQFIIGTRLDIAEYFPRELIPAPRATKCPTLGEAICDLPPLKAGYGEEKTEYDMERRKVHITKYGRRYLYETLQVQRATKLTAHRARPHSNRDLRDFEKLREGEHCAEAIKRGATFEFPYNRETFKDRYTRQHRSELCSTIVAHLSKDGLMFIHPTQTRSLTPREAARIQSFPDWFEFPVARTHQFRLIGNAVPPLVAEAVGLTAKSYLEKTMKNKNPARFDLDPLPADHDKAIQWLFDLLEVADKKTLKQLSDDQFKRGWYSISFLYPGLHPDSALNHGTRISSNVETFPDTQDKYPQQLTHFYVQSGWPVALAPVAKEAWRRFKIDKLKDEEFYCNEAIIAGMIHRNPNIIKRVNEEQESLSIKQH